MPIETDLSCVLNAITHDAFSMRAWHLNGVGLSSPPFGHNYATCAKLQLEVALGRAIG